MQEDNYTKLNDSEINILYDTLPNWEVIDKKFLSKIITLNSFTEAADFIKKIATIADKMNHHPDIEIFNYKNVKIKLYDHKLDGLTKQDINLANKIDQLK
jgi:4a-hydroxytetrahydrobiopterin dehydratase